MHLGGGFETRPLYQTVLAKSFFFSLLVLVFHFLEEFIKRLIHHEPSGTVVHNINPDQMIGRMLLVFCTFIPLFAFLELRRILGGQEFYRLFFKPGGANPSPRNGLRSRGALSFAGAKKIQHPPPKTKGKTHVKPLNYLTPSNQTT
jgi:hypothetical protein